VVHRHSLRSTAVTTVDVLRVFVGDDGQGGNPLGVVLDGAAVPEPQRQALAARLGFSETVFVDDVIAGRVRIFTPAAELAFAGHPLVGTGWLLRREGHTLDVLRPPAGDVPTWQEDGVSWIRGRPEWVPPMTVRELPGPEAVDALGGAPPGVDFLYAWAWLDRDGGVVRARAFPHVHRIAEDEATGAAAVLLTGLLGRALSIHQGVGSRLITRPAADGAVDVGGRVEQVETRELP
jgi:predicted PhzF superfamily epimerase YddE/YHI9